MATPKARAKTPDHLAHLLAHSLTDAGIEERNERPARKSDIARITRDADFDQRLAELSDEQAFGTDPMKEVADQFKSVNPDFACRFLSDKVVRKLGHRGWEAVKKNNGDPVKVGDMVLAAMPCEFASIRDKKYRDEGNNELRTAKARLAEDQARLIRNGAGVGLSPLTSNDNMFPNDDDPTESFAVGLTSQRG